MASKHGYADKGSIRNIMVVMKSLRGVVLVDGHSSEVFDVRVVHVHIMPTTSANTWLPNMQLVILPMLLHVGIATGHLKLSTRHGAP